MLRNGGRIEGEGSCQSDWMFEGGRSGMVSTFV